MNADRRLRPGQTFTLQGVTWRVDMVNECRAHCVRLGTETRHIVTRRGDVRTFEAPYRQTLDISPYSVLPASDESGPRAPEPARAGLLF